MKYILDFDRTLFDTPAYYQKVAELKLEEIQFDPEIWKQIEADEFLYEDVIDWLSTKSQEDLYILTAVNPNYGDGQGTHQKGKLTGSKVEELVSDVVFTQGLKGEHVAEIAKQFPPDETIVFVDDMLEQCVSVKNTLPDTVCCLIVRDESLIEKVDIPEGIKVVRCLSEVDDIIKNA